METVFNYTKSMERMLIEDGVISTSSICDPWYDRPWFGGYMVYTCEQRDVYEVFAHLEAPTAANAATMSEWNSRCAGVPHMTAAALGGDPFYMNYAHIFSGS